MTDNELKAIEKRANAATPGPWEESDDSLLTGGGDKWGRHTLMAWSKILHPELMPQWRNNANGAFIAHAREDIPALIAEIRRLRKLANDA